MHACVQELHRLLASTHRLEGLHGCLNGLGVNDLLLPRLLRQPPLLLLLCRQQRLLCATARGGIGCSGCVHRGWRAGGGGWRGRSLLPSCLGSRIRGLLSQP